MQQKVDPARVLELSQRMKTLNRSVENHWTGMHREISRLVNDTSNAYSEPYVRQMVHEVESLLREIKTLSESTARKLDKKESDLRWAAEQYYKTEKEAVSKAKHSSKFGWAKQVFTWFNRNADRLRSRVMDAAGQLLKHPPSLVDLIKGLVNHAKDASIESRLDAFKEDERIASLLDIMKTGEEKDQIWAREELQNIAEAFDEIAKNQTTYGVYSTYGNQAYMDKAREQAERQRSILSGLGVNPKWFGPDVNLRSHYTDSPLSACEYNPLKTDGSAMPTEDELRFVISAGLVNEKYREWAKASYPQIEIAVKKMIAEREALNRLMDEYNRSIPREDIEKMQEFLKEQSLYSGEVTGQYNEEFLNAVKSYQQQMNFGVQDGKVDERLLQLVEDSEPAGWLTPVGVTEGVASQIGDDVVDTVTGFVEFVPETYALVKAIANGEISLEDIKNSLGASLAAEYVEPFKTLDRLSGKVANGTATYDECVEYGRALTKVAQVFLVAVTAAKSGVQLTSKAMNKLNDIAPKIPENLSPKVVGHTNERFNVKVPDTRAPELPDGLTDVQANYRKVMMEKDRVEGTGEVNKTFVDTPFDEAGNLKSNVKYKAGEHQYDYETDHHGRIEKFSTDELKLTTREERLPHDSNTPGKEPGDHAGHLAGDRFGGSPEIDNLVSQSSKVNLSEYKKIENEWAKALQSNPPKHVSVEVRVNYEGDSLRPSSFNVIYEIDGKIKVVDLVN